MDRQILQMGPYSFFLSPVAFHILRNLSFMEYLLFRFFLVSALLQQTEMTHRHWKSLRLIKDQVWVLIRRLHYSRNWIFENWLWQFLCDLFPEMSASFNGRALPTTSFRTQNRVRRQFKKVLGMASLLWKLTHFVC